MHQRKTWAKMKLVEIMTETTAPPYEVIANNKSWNSINGILSRVTHKGLNKTLTLLGKFNRTWEVIAVVNFYIFFIVLNFLLNIISCRIKDLLNSVNKTHLNVFFYTICVHVFDKSMARYQRQLFNAMYIQLKLSKKKHWAYKQWKTLEEASYLQTKPT